MSTRKLPEISGDGPVMNFHMDVPSNLVKKARAIAVMTDKATGDVVADALREYIAKHFPVMMK